MDDRNKVIYCPSCNSDKCSRAFRTAPHVIWFPGSFTHDDRSDKLERLAKEAQAEGFRSTQEMEVAQEQANARAARLGVEPSRILGGTKANFEGELKIEQKDTEKEKRLYQNYLEAGMLKKDNKAAANAQLALKEHQVSMKEKYKGARKYKPTKSREQCKSEARSQERNFTKQV